MDMRYGQQAVDCQTLQGSSCFLWQRAGGEDGAWLHGGLLTTYRCDRRLYRTAPDNPGATELLASQHMHACMRAHTHTHTEVLRVSVMKSLTTVWPMALLTTVALPSTRQKWSHERGGLSSGGCLYEEHAHQRGHVIGGLLYYNAWHCITTLLQNSASMSKHLVLTKLHITIYTSFPCQPGFGTERNLSFSFHISQSDKSHKMLSMTHILKSDLMANLQSDLMANLQSDLMANSLFSVL